MKLSLIILLALIGIPAVYHVYALLQTEPDIEHVPVKHLAIIMDGNRRWAKERNLQTREGHQKGAEVLRWLVQYCLEHKIEMVSVYAFSLENFQRSPEELQALFTIMIEESEKALPNLIKHGIKVRFIGDRNLFPVRTHSMVEKVEKETASGAKLALNILFCYGGRQEILAAVKQIVNDVKAGKLTDAPDEETFKKYLWTSTIPDPDLIIRTGGFKRLSNFITYQSTYSELYFIDRFWPDLTEKDLDEALREYGQRKRNFGT